MKKEKTTPINGNAKRSIFHLKITKIIASSVALLSLIVAGYGIYSLNKNNINPRDGWSEELTTATKQINDLPEINRTFGKYEISVINTYDDKHNSEPCRSLHFGYGNMILISMSFFEHDAYTKYNSTAFAFRVDEYLESIDEMPEWLDMLKFRLAFDGESTSFGADIALLRNRISATVDCPVVTNNDKLDISNLDLLLNAAIIKTKDIEVMMHIEQTLQPNGVIYNLMYDALNIFYPVAKMFLSTFFSVLSTYLGFPYSNVDDYVNDIRRVANVQSTNTKVGNISLLVTLPIFFMAICVLLLPALFMNAKAKKTVLASTSTYSTSKVKPTRATKKLTQSKVKSKLSLFNVVTLNTFIIAAISISAIMANVVLGYYLNPNLITFTNIDIVHIIGKNLLIVGLMFLTFFGALYIAKKDNRTFKQIIVVTFLAGLFYYLFNIISCQYIGNSYSVLTSFLDTTLDNIFVPLFLGLSTYYCLFKTPKAHIAKALAVLAVILLIVGCFVDPISANITIKSYYLTSLFSPNLIIANMFIVIYLIATYIVSLINYKKHKNISYAEYLNSAQNIKHTKIIANVVISTLFVIDLLCRFFMQANIFNFSYNHGVLLLIPIIWMYKPQSDQKEVKVNPLMITLIALVVLSAVATFTQSLNASTNLLRGI